MIRVDTHAHVFERALPQVADRRYVPARDALLTDYLAQLDQHGLTHGMLVQPSFLGTDNAYLLAAIASAPNRLRGVAVVDPSMSSDDLNRLAAGGVVGIRLNVLEKQTPELGGADWERLLEFVATHRWHVEVHGHIGEVVKVLRQLTERDLRVVIDHFGRPDRAKGCADPAFQELLKSADTGRVWVKLSGAYRFDDDAYALAASAAEQLLAAFGPTRLVWGSDWPHTTFEARATFARAFGQLASWVPEERARSMILGATAAGLFHLPEVTGVQF